MSLLSSLVQKLQSISASRWLLPLYARHDYAGCDARTAGVLWQELRREMVSSQNRRNPQPPDGSMF